MDESPGWISATEEFAKGLLDKIWQPMAAIGGVGKETVEFACNDAVERRLARSLLVLAWGL